MINHYPPQEAIDLFKKRTNHHIELVQNNIYLWQDREEYNHIFDELSLRAINHDQSKFSEPELTPYVWLTWRSHCIINNIPFDLPTGMDQKIRDAVFHHVSNNRHHPEWHLDPDSMTEVDLIEMICDWKAVGQEFGEKNLAGYAERVLGRRFNFSQNKLKLIWDLINKIDRMVEENEKIKKQIKEMTPSNEELLKMVERQKRQNYRQNYPKPETMVSEKLSKEERESLNANTSLSKDSYWHSVSFAKDGSMIEGSWYLSYKAPEEYIELDGTFSTKELELIVEHMKKVSEK